tara:strand:+ start:967 stop:1350 length:384 start_codon:yes stop_codon:yes gene_type:complete
MKLYSSGALNKNNFSAHNKRTRKETFLISNEGIFKLFGKSIKKMIIKKDDVEHLNESNEKLILDNSEIIYIEYNKVPFVYTQQENDEELFIVNDDISIVCVNDVVWYIEFNNKAHLTTAINIIRNNV